MSRGLFVRCESWPLKRPFSLSRGTKTAADVVYVEVRDANDIGRGECVPYARYGESLEGVVAIIESQREDME
ncbi:MAG: dipeptide epimerase, partial [Woeseia sp.]